MSRFIVAIDPGVVSGWALFKGTRLVQAGACRPNETCLNLPSCPSLAAMVVEVPRIYPSGGKGDQNQLIDLAFLAGRFAAARDKCTIYYPRQWKGTVPKKIHQPRILLRLTEDESKGLYKRPRAKDYDHNMIDAIGIGLYHLGRM